jgi:hypothetical protein
MHDVNRRLVLGGAGAAALALLTPGGSAQARLTELGRTQKTYAEVLGNLRQISAELKKLPCK